MPDYVIVIAVLVLIFGPKAFKEVKDYLLKRDQIKADASLKAEALRLKNEIELEKLIQNGFGSMEYKQESKQENKQTSVTGEDGPEEQRKSDRLRY